MIHKNLAYTARLANSAEDLVAALRLRYKVFIEEFNAKPAQLFADGQERDRFDPFVDHILLIDAEDQVIGVTRIMRADQAKNANGFYSAAEYDLSVFETSTRPVAELGRSCIAPEHRGGTALMTLWQGLANYVTTHGIEILFGVASFQGTDPMRYAQPLSYLHHTFQAPQHLRARSKQYVPMDILRADQVDRMTALQHMPTLIKSYLRLGGLVGDGAFVDDQFNTVDVCIVMDTKQLSDKYRKLLRHTET